MTGSFVAPIKAESEDRMTLIPFVRLVFLISGFTKLQSTVAGPGRKDNPVAVLGLGLMVTSG